MEQARIAKRKVEEGDFIYIPSSKAFGLVVEAYNNTRDNSQVVELQEHPEIERTRIFKLAPNDFEFDE